MARVRWHRQAIGELNFPQVCVVTGQPATTNVNWVFRNKATIFLPRRVAWIVSALNRPVAMRLPTTSDTASSIRNRRLLIVAGLGLLVLGFVVACIPAIPTLLRSLAFFGGLIAAVAVALTGMVTSNMFGADVKSDWLEMTKAHPAFVDALLRANRHGVVFADDGVTPQQQTGYPQQQAPQGYPPQQMPQGYPQHQFPQGQPQQQQYPQGYPQQQAPQGYPQQQVPHGYQPQQPTQGYQQQQPPHGYQQPPPPGYGG